MKFVTSKRAGLKRQRKDLKILFRLVAPAQSKCSKDKVNTSVGNMALEGSMFVHAYGNCVRATQEHFQHRSGR